MERNLSVQEAAPPSVFTARIEPVEGGWRVSCPALEQHGAFSWGETPEEALENLSETVQRVVERLVDDGGEIPEGLWESEGVTPRPQISVVV